MKCEGGLEDKASTVRAANFDCVWFSRKTAVLESTSMFSGSISHVDNDGVA